MVGPDEAARTLSEISHRHQQVVDTAAIPDWFWWAIGALMVAFSVAVDTRRPLVVGVAVALFVLGVVAVTLRVALPGVRRARLRNDLLGPRGVGAILGFVALVLAVTLPTAFILDASGVAHAAVIGVALGAALLTIGGPILNRHLRRVMLGRRA